MKKILYVTIIGLLTLAGCGKSDDKTEEKLIFKHENTPNVVRVGEDVYYKENGVEKNHLFGFLDNEFYYFTEKDNKGIKFDVKQLTKNVINISVPMGSSIFIAEGDDRAVVIDTAVGIGNVKNMVEMFLEDKPYDVLMTHTHVDHVGGIFDFETVYTTTKDAEWAPNRWGLDGRLNYAGVTEEKGIYSIKDFAKETESYNFSYLEDGDVFNLGNYDVEVYEVPGHTLGSAIYLLKQDRILLSGDDACPSTLLSFNDGEIRYDSETVETYEENLKKLNKNNDKWDYVLTSHTNGTLESKSLIDDLIDCCEDIKTKNPSNASVEEQQTKFSKTINGHRIAYNTARIYNV